MTQKIQPAERGLAPVQAPILISSDQNYVLSANNFIALVMPRYTVKKLSNYIVEISSIQGVGLFDSSTDIVLTFGAIFD